MRHGFQKRGGGGGGGRGGGSGGGGGGGGAGDRGKGTLCSFYGTGRCKHGTRCKFAHTAEELAPTWRTQACKFFTTGRCVARSVALASMR